MTIYRITSDATFSADDIDSAFRVLSNHFAELANGNLDAKLIESGEIRIEPIREEETAS